MIEKEKAIEILEEIQSQLNYKDWQEAEKTVNTYVKNLEISINEKLKELIDKHTIYREKYGEESFRTKMLAKKIDKELSEIYNKKY